MRNQVPETSFLARSARELGAAAASAMQGSGLLAGFAGLHALEGLDDLERGAFAFGQIHRLVRVPVVHRHRRMLTQVSAYAIEPLPGPRHAGIENKGTTTFPNFQTQSGIASEFAFCECLL